MEREAEWEAALPAFKAAKKRRKKEKAKRKKAERIREAEGEDELPWRRAKEVTAFAEQRSLKGSQFDVATGEAVWRW